MTTESNIEINQIKNAVQRVCSKKQIYVSNFLNPFEQQLWSNEHQKVDLSFYGGYPQAERKIVLVKALNDKDVLSIEDYQFVWVAASINAFNSLTHRQVLGTLMHNGLKRQVIGDILLTDSSVQIAVKKSIVKFFLIQSFKIRQNILNFKIISPRQLIIPKSTESLKNIVVASLRLDAFLAKTINLSRNKVQHLIVQNQVFVNFKLVNKSTYLLTENDLITVRGFAKIKMKKIVGRSKKGKILIAYQKV